MVVPIRRFGVTAKVGEWIRSHGTVGMRQRLAGTAIDRNLIWKLARDQNPLVQEAAVKRLVAFELPRTPAEALAIEGNIYLSLDKFERSQLLFKDALRIDSNCVKAHVGLGDFFQRRASILQSLGLDGTAFLYEAKKYLEIAARLAPNDRAISSQLKVVEANLANL